MMTMQKTAAFVLAATFIVPTASHTSSSPVAASERGPVVEEWMSYTSSSPVAGSEVRLVADKPRKVLPDPELRTPDLCLMDGCTDDEIVICPAKRRVKEMPHADDCTRRPPNIEPLEEVRREPKVDLGSRGSRLP